jgi:3-hydroxyisobutyrate dehydrogenase-like beta-hydroxyacid dehydrogenase
MIGLGRMGGPMADCAIRAGHDVRVFDVSDDAVAARVAAGARACRSVAEACEGTRVVSVVVFDDAQVLEVVAGDRGVFGAVEPGAVVVVHTTVRIDTIETLADAAADRGVRLLDAGISGGETGATAGTLVVMVGGDAGALETARPVLDTAKGEDPPVEVWNGGESQPGDDLEQIAPTFGEFLLEGVQEELADQ